MRPPDGPLPAQELSSRVVGPALRMLRRLRGKAAVDELLARSSLDRASVEDPSGWVPYASVARVYRDLEELTGVPDAQFQSGLDFAAVDTVGPVYHIARALGSPAILLSRFQSLNERFSKVSAWTVELKGRTRAEVRFRLDEGYEDYAYYCAHRQGILTGVPTTFGLPLARVEHPVCRVRGEGEECVYEVSWVPRGFLPRLTGVLAALGLFGAVAWTLLVGTVSPPAAALVVAATLLFGLSLVVDGLRVHRQTLKATREQFVELRRQYEDKLRAVEEMNVLRRIDELTRLERDEALLLGHAVDELHGKLDFDFVMGSFGEAGGGLRMVHCAGVDGSQRRHLVETSLAATEEADLEPLLAPLGLRGALGLVLLKGSPRPASLVVGNRVRRLTELDARFLAQAANPLSLAIENARTLTHLDELVLARTEELRSAQDDLLRQARLASVGQLVSGLVHEINNPLNFSRNGAEELLRRLDAEGAEKLVDVENLRRAARIVMHGSDRIREVVDALRAFSSGRGSEELRAVDLREVLDATLALAQVRLQERRIEIVRDYADIPPVECRSGEIHQVVLNLLNNAIKAMEPGPGTLTVATRRDGGSVVVSIADTGPGIPADIRERIFDAFFTTRPPGQGTGLGLSIASRIVNGHRGTLRVADAEVGACLELLLPSRSGGEGDG